MNSVLIGAGPRGLVAAERLIEHQNATKKFKQLNIKLVDPFGIGGRVWQTNQSHELIMNTNPNYVTVFTDDKVQIDGPIVAGPNLFQWLQTEAIDYIEQRNFTMKAQFLAEIEALKPTEYASRGLFGVYLNWFYDYLQTRLTEGTTLEVVEEEALSVTPVVGTDQYVVKTSNYALTADNVVMALGHFENKPTPEQVTLRRFALDHDVTYVYPMQPQEYALKELPAGKPMIIRGLGLSFIDAMAMLTIGRGGKFTRDVDGYLRYEPSGKEPKIIAGSRIGVPLRSKGTNQKTDGELVPSRFFTTDWFNQHDGEGQLDGATFVQMMHHEVEYVYYEHLLAEKYPDIDATAFLHDFVQNPEETVAKSAIDSADYYNWDRLMHPANYISDLDKSDVMADFLKYDIDEAKKGTKTGPLTSSFEVFRDTRDVYRRIATQNLLSPDDYRRDFLGTFNYQNSHLAVGPPEIRIEQLRALITAGVVQLLGPQMVVDTDEETGKFVTWSATLPDQKHESTYLLEGRLPSIKVSESQNPLIQQMLRDELAQPHEMKLANGESFRTGAMDVDVQTEQLLVNGQANQHLFFWGVPTEGKHWFTTASPRPYTNDVTFRLGDGIVDQIFETK